MKKFNTGNTTVSKTKNNKTARELKERRGISLIRHEEVRNDPPSSVCRARFARIVAQAGSVLGSSEEPAAATDGLAGEP